MANVNSEEILNLYKAGMTSTQISEALNVPYEEVWEATKDYAQSMQSVTTLNKVAIAPTVFCPACGGEAKVIGQRVEEGKKEYSAGVIVALLILALFTFGLSILGLIAYFVVGGEAKNTTVYTYKCNDCGLTYEKRVK